MKRKAGLYRTVMNLDDLEAVVYYQNGELYWKTTTRFYNKGNKATRLSNRYLEVKIKGKALKAQIQFNKKKYAIGNYKTEDDAARAYDDRAKILFKEYAVLNFP